MRKYIAVITTGGTIGSVLGEHSVGVDATGGAIGEAVRRAAEASGHTLRTIAALDLNSESIEPEDWLILIDHVEAALADGCTQIVITHGTDTLHYTAAMIAGVFSNRGARICLTGSFHVPEHPHSDAALSLQAAIAVVRDANVPGGVFVAFREDITNERAVIYPAVAIKPMGFDERVFRGVFNACTATFTPSSGLQLHAPIGPVAGMGLPDLGPVTAEQIRDAAARVAVVPLHPGMTMAFLADAGRGRDILILEPYHSGTGPGAPRGGLGAYLRSQPDVDLIVSQFPDRYLDAPYASTRQLQALGAHVVKELQTHTLYVWAVMQLARGDTSEAVLNGFSPWMLTRA